MLNNGTLVYTPGVITTPNAHSDTLTYTLTDTVTGAFISQTQTVMLERAPPPAPIITGISPHRGDNGNVTNVATVTVSGTAEANSFVRLYDDGTLVGTATTSTGAWSAADVMLAQGSNTLTATATDKIGITSDLGSFTATLDTTATELALLPSAARIVTMNTTFGPRADLWTGVRSVDRYGWNGGVSFSTAFATFTIPHGYILNASLSFYATGTVPGTIVVNTNGTPAEIFPVGLPNSLASAMAEISMALSTQGETPVSSVPVLTTLTHETLILAGAQIAASEIISATGDHEYTLSFQGSSAFSISDVRLSITLDPGPIAGNISPTIKLGQSIDLTDAILAGATAGMPGDTLTLIGDETTGTLGGVRLIDGKLTYIAVGAALSGVPAGASTIDSFGYTISDQHGDTVTGTVQVTVTNPVAPPPPAVLIETQWGVNLTLADFTQTVHLAGYNNTVTAGDGDHTIDGSFGGSSVTLGNGNNVIALGGYGNYIKVGDGHNTIDAGLGSETIDIAGGTASVKAQGFYDVFNIDGGTTEITGFAGYATINLGAHFAGNNSVDLRGLAGDVFTFAHGVGTITKLDGELVATVNAHIGQTLSAIGDGTDGLKIVLGTVNPLPQPALTVLTGTKWGVDLILADFTKAVHLVGYNNTVTAGDGDHTIDGDNGGLVLTLGSGNNTVAVNGYHDTINLGVGPQGGFTGTGDNTVTGTLGSTLIHTGAGNQTITAAGYYNDITTGAGNSVINAGAGYSHVSTGDGHNIITVGGNENTVTTHDGDSIVTLNGWTNLIQAGVGHTQVSGGYFNTYEVTGLGTHGGIEITDFSTQFGDVLNLHDVIGTGDKVTVADSLAGDLLISVVHGAITTQVADLHGLAGKSMADLVANHSLVM